MFKRFGRFFCYYETRCIGILFSVSHVICCKVHYIPYIIYVFWCVSTERRAICIRSSLGGISDLVLLVSQLSGGMHLDVYGQLFGGH